MALNAMDLTSRDMARARLMLRDQSKGEDPYDLLDGDEGDDPEARDKRRVLIIWCLRSRTDPEFTWEQAWDVPFSEVYADDDEEPDEAPPTPGLANAGSEPGPTPNAASKRKRRDATPAPS